MARVHRHWRQRLTAQEIAYWISIGSKRAITSILMSPRLHSPYPSRMALPNLDGEGTVEVRGSARALAGQRGLERRGTARVGPTSAQ